ncbi:MAG: AAA family ATPase [Acidimicrobiales bacterium]
MADLTREEARVHAASLNGAKAAPADEQREPTTWTPVDLTDALAGVDVDPPSLGARSDGFCLLYPGRTHAFQGESESCKSWGAQLVARQEIELGNDVLYIDFEDDAAGVVARLLALGLTPAQVAAHLVYIRPDEPLNGRHGEATPASADLLDAFEGRRFALAVIDGVTEAMTTEGLELIGNSDVATWMRRLPRRIARTGAAVVVLDHLPKDRMSQGRYAIGGQHKLAGLTGAAYKFTLTKWFSRATGIDPVEGRVLITVEKDRPGYVRGRATDDKVGEFRLISYPDGGVTLSIDPIDPARLTDRRMADRILAHLIVYDGSSKNSIEQAVQGRAATVRESLSWMTEQGWIRVERKGNGHLHWLTDLGRLESDGTRDEVEHAEF